MVFCTFVVYRIKLETFKLRQNHLPCMESSIDWLIDGSIDWLLNIQLDNFPLMWRRHRAYWTVAKWGPLLGAYCLWATKRHGSNRLFVWGFFVQLDNFSLIWRHHNCRWRAANFDLCSALVAIDQWGFFSVPQLLWHGASVNNGHLRGPVTLTLLAERFTVELSLPVLTT